MRRGVTPHTRTLPCGRMSALKYGVTVSTMATEKRPATFGDGRAAQHFPGIRALGFHGVDLFIKPMPATELAGLKKSLASCGLEVSVVFPVMVFESGLSLSDPDPESRTMAVRTFKSQIDLAAGLKAKIVLGLSRGNPVAGEPESAFQDPQGDEMLENQRLGPIREQPARTDRSREQKERRHGDGAHTPVFDRYVSPGRTVSRIFRTLPPAYHAASPRHLPHEHRGAIH